MRPGTWAMTFFFLFFFKFFRPWSSDSVWKWVFTGAPLHRWTVPISLWVAAFSHACFTSSHLYNLCSASWTASSCSHARPLCAQTLLYAHALAHAHTHWCAQAKVYNKSTSCSWKMYLVFSKSTHLKCQRWWNVKVQPSLTVAIDKSSPTQLWKLMF